MHHNTCITTVCYADCFNGFIWTPSSRQGDPLSLYLFLFGADDLCLKNEVSANLITPVKVTLRAYGISHLLYADDSLLFVKDNAKKAWAVKLALSIFCEATGQQLNAEKCSLISTETCSQTRCRAMAGIQGTSQTSFEPKYMGLPTPGRMKMSVFRHQRRLGKKLLSYMERDLSLGFKKILVKLVSQTIPTYIMTVSRLHEGVCGW